jgi:hypothetical protein
VNKNASKGRESKMESSNETSELVTSYYSESGSSSDCADKPVTYRDVSGPKCTLTITFVECVEIIFLNHDIINLYNQIDREKVQINKSYFQSQ